MTTNKPPVVDTGSAYRNVNVSGLFGDTTPDSEKPALKSKKFIAFLVTTIGFFLLMILIVTFQDVEGLGSNLAFMTLTISQGFLAVGYILGQSSLDKFLRATGRGEPSPEKKEGT